MAPWTGNVCGMLLRKSGFNYTDHADLKTNRNLVASIPTDLRFPMPREVGVPRSKR